MELNQKSKLYKFLTRAGCLEPHWEFIRNADGGGDYNPYTDTCTVLKALVVGAGNTILVGGVIASLFASTIDCLLWLIFMLVNQRLIEINNIGVGGAMLIGVAVLFAFVFLIRKITDIPSEPSMLTELYRSWRDKVCMRIEVK